MDTNATVEANVVSLAKRKRLTDEQRKAILERYHQSDLTQEAFAAQHGMCSATLGNWLRAERESATAAVPGISFQELRLPAAGGSWAVEIVTPQNWILRLAQVPPAGVLQQLLRVWSC